MRISKELAEAVYDILVSTCGARHEGIDDFIAFMTNEDRSLPDEYRFQGNLGFGGKLYISNYHVEMAPDMLVSCYVEDRTPEREEMIRSANLALSKIQWPNWLWDNS